MLLLLSNLQICMYLVSMSVTGNHTIRRHGAIKTGLLTSHGVEKSAVFANSKKQLQQNSSEGH